MIKPEMKKKMTNKQQKYDEDEEDYHDESSTSSPSHDKDSLASEQSASNNKTILKEAGVKDDVKNKGEEQDDGNDDEDDNSHIDDEDNEDDNSSSCSSSSRNNSNEDISNSGSNGNSNKSKKGKEGKRKRWTVEEDEICKKIIEEEMRENPHRSRLDWKRVEIALNGSKNSHQCRERWRLRLDPKIRDNNWTIEEETLLLNLQRQYGNRWVLIASKINGKSECACKSHYRSVLKRKKKKQANGTNSTSQHISTEGKRQRGNNSVSDDIDKHTSLPSPDLPTVQLHRSPYPQQQIHFNNDIAFDRSTKRMKKADRIAHASDKGSNIPMDAKKSESAATTPSLIPSISSTPPQNVVSALAIQQFHPYGYNHQYISTVQHYHHQQQLAQQQTNALYLHHLQQQQLIKANETTGQQQLLDYLQMQPQQIHIQAQRNGQLLIPQPMLTIPPYSSHFASNFQIQR